MKKLLLGAVVVAVAMSAQAEPLRTLLTKENQLPEKGQLELGALAETAQYSAYGAYAEMPYLRYGLFGNLAVYAGLPFREIRFKQGMGLNQNGIGDVAVGAELVAYEDFFRFPYILPHLEVQFPTGDKDKGLGTGETSFLGGVTVGTKTWECLNWAVDVTAAHLATNDPNLKNDTVHVSGSIVWDLDETFSLVTEVGGSDQTYKDGHPITFECGMIYKPIENLMFGVYGGKTLHTDESWNGTFKAAYSF